MVVGVLRIELRLPEVHSLKEKRGEVKWLINRVRTTYNVSVAEVAENDLWQKAVIGITLVGNEGGFVNSCLDQILNFVEDLGVGEVIDQEMEIIHF